MPHPTRGPSGRSRLAPLLLATASLLTWTPTAVAKPDQATVQVRSGSHPGFERLVVDWPTAATPQLRQEEGLVRVIFPARERLDLSGVAPAPGGPVLAVEASQAREGTELLVRVRPGAEPHLSVLPDHRVVLDIAGADAPPSRPAPRRAQAQTPAAEYRSVAPTPTGPPTAHPVEAASPQASAAPPAALAPADPLHQELYRRDLMIASLLQRVERLEHGASLPEQPLDQVVGGAGPGSSDPPGQEAPADAAKAQPQKPAPVSTERALERVLTLTGTLLLRPGEVEIEPLLAFSSRKTNSPVFMTEPGTGTVFIANQEVRRKELTGTLGLRAGLPFDSQFELAVPYRYVHQSDVTSSGGMSAHENDANGNGLGDIEIAASKTLLRQRGWLPDLVARAYWNTGTGEKEEGGVPLGSGYDELGAALTALKRQDPLAFFATLSYQNTLSQNHLDPGDQYGLIVGAALAVSPETSLRAAFQQDFVGKSQYRNDSLGGSDQTIGILSLDAASLIGRGVLVDVGVDVGLTSDAPDYTARISLPIRFNLPVL